MAPVPDASSSAMADGGVDPAAKAAYFAVAVALHRLSGPLREKRVVDAQPLLAAIDHYLAVLQRDERMPLSLASAPHAYIVRESGQPLLAVLTVHGVNTLTYSVKISRDLGVPEKRLPYLALAALCHNLGLLAASDADLKRLTDGVNHAAELAGYEAHTLEYLRLMRLPGPFLETVEALLALARNNEQSLSRTSMHEAMAQYAMIIHVCCVFEQLTHQRSYGEVLAPVDALRKMRGEMKDYFHPEIIKLFFNHLSVYPLGSFVKLNSHETAKIVAMNPGFIMRPVVAIVLDEEDQEKPEPVRLNLRDKPNLYIKRAVVDDALVEKYINLF